MGLVVVVSLGSFGRWCAGVSALVCPCMWRVVGDGGCRSPTVRLWFDECARVEC